MRDDIGQRAIDLLIQTVACQGIVDLLENERLSRGRRKIGGAENDRILGNQFERGLSRAREEGSKRERCRKRPRDPNAKYSSANDSPSLDLWSKFTNHRCLHCNATIIATSVADARILG